MDWKPYVYHQVLKHDPLELYVSQVVVLGLVENYKNVLNE